jgi:hypothetical protein
LQPPNSHIEEVLFCLITKGSASIVDFRYMPGFRTRCSELDLYHNLKMDNEDAEGENKFGRKFRYVIHKLPFSEMENAVNIYKKLQKIKE